MTRRLLSLYLLAIVAVSSGATASRAAFREVSPDAPLRYAPAEYVAIVNQSARSAGVPAWILDALLWEESRYIPNARNVNADCSIDKGAAQFNSRYMVDFIYRDNFGAPFDPDDPAQAIPVAARYLARLYRMTGSWSLSVMAYNCGPGRVKRGDVPEKTKAYAGRVCG